MSSFQILDAAVSQQREVWMELWNSWPAHEVFGHPDFLSLFREPNDSIKCALYATERGQLIFPFRLRDLSTLDWFTTDDRAADLVGPYGYGGAYCIGDLDPSSFWDYFAEWANQNAVVSMFVRLSLFPEQLATSCPADIEVKSRNVVRWLNLTPKDLWMDYEHKVRKNVNMARRQELRVESDPSGDRLQDFLTIYYATMDRNNANEVYYFDETFFRSIIEKLAGSYVFFHVWDKERIVASELVLMSADYLYSFLGGTLREAYSLRPNDLLKHSIIEWGREHEKKAFVLGGGYEDGDGIFRYKKSFAPESIVPFKVAKWIFDAERYADLIEQRRTWELALGRKWNPSPDFFPAYRS